jgi:solute carrier family 10 (sodium/bile acid cotransporter), member 7
MSRSRLQRSPAWVDWFLVGLLSVIAIASIVPARGAARGVFSVLATCAVSLLFFIHGAKLSPSAAWAGARQWRLHLTVFAVTFVVFPLLGLALRVLQPAILSHQLYLGVLFLCAMPSTVQSSIAFTAIARGNVAAAVCSASFSNLAGVVLSPLLVALLLGSSAHISGHSVLTLGLQLVLPFALGQLARRWVAPSLSRHPRATSMVDRGSILLVVYSAFSAGVVAGIWHDFTIWQLAAVAMVDLVLLVVVLNLTRLASRRLGFARPDQVVITFCGSKKSLATGLPMASVLFAGHDVSVIVLPLMLFHQIQLVVCAVLARRYRRRADAEPISPVGSAVSSRSPREPVQSHA